MKQLTLVVCSLLLALLSGCGGGGGGGGGTAGTSTTSGQSAAAANELPMTVELWSGNSRFPNQGYVSVQVCQPQTNNCQTIDHVLVDTGSYGLRVLASALTLPLQQNTLNNAALAECTSFFSGYTWGGVYNSDVVLGQQKASAVPIQVIDGSYARLPNSCASSPGVPMMTQAAIGANGILGVGSFQQDCPACSQQALPGHYYTCTPGGACTPVAVPLSAQVTNPVAMLPTNDNGVVIDFKSTPSTTAQVSATGKLILGVGTQANNAIQNETIFGLDSNGHLTTIYNGFTYTQSYLDSGANGTFVTDSSLNSCKLATGLYCPSTDVIRTATISSGTTAQTVSFIVSNADVMTGQGVQPGLAGTGSSFAWGLPFFYGRKVFVSISGKSAQGRTTPFVAF